MLLRRVENRRSFRMRKRGLLCAAVAATTAHFFTLGLFVRGGTFIGLSCTIHELGVGIGVTDDERSSVSQGTRARVSFIPPSRLCSRIMRFFFLPLLVSA